MRDPVGARNLARIELPTSVRLAEVCAYYLSTSAFLSIRHGSLDIQRQPTLRS